MITGGAQARARPAAARRRPPRRPSRATARRRRLLAALVAIAVTVGIVLAAMGPVQRGIREIVLPLQHEDIIRQQAAEKHLDPALIAAVIFQESKFEDRTSATGAKGLMQIQPDTARFIARKSGGTRFQLRDLATPQINIAYGSWYLRYLIDRYSGNQTLAIAAYNAGSKNVDRWVHGAGGPDSFDPSRDIPFAETRAYLSSVLRHEGEYRHRYGHELGLN